MSRDYSNRNRLRMPLHGRGRMADDNSNLIASPHRLENLEPRLLLSGNVSPTPVDPLPANSISGVVYHDLDKNDVWDHAPTGPVRSPVIDLAEFPTSGRFAVDASRTGRQLGTTAASIGDFNGDGADDIFLVDGDQAAANGIGFVVYGNEGRSSGGIADVFAMDTATGFTVVGPDGLNLDGLNIEHGDFNYDGLSDFAIGLPFTDPNGQESGSVYVVYGRAATSGTLDIQSLDGSNGYVIHGEDAYDRFGESMEAGVTEGEYAWDVNHPYPANLYIGAPGYDHKQLTNSGAIYKYYGSVDDVPAVRNASALTRDEGRINVGTNKFDGIGREGSFVFSPNLNAFGPLPATDLMIVGDAPNYDGLPHKRIYASFDFKLDDNLVRELNTDPGLGGVFMALKGIDHTSKVSIGDYDVWDRERWDPDTWNPNKDAILVAVHQDASVSSDLFAVSPRAARWSSSPHVGEVDEGYQAGVYAGTDMGFQLDVADIGLGIPGIRGSIELPLDAEFRVENAGDVNHDGLGDFIISVDSTDANGKITTTSRVLLPQIDLQQTPIDAESINGLHGFIIRDSSQADSSVSVHAGGDFDGDGVRDLIATPTNTVDQAYVVYSSSAWSNRSNLNEDIRLDEMRNVAGLVIEPQDGDKMFGRDAGSLGDFNGDGVDDFFVTATPIYPDIQDFPGKVYIYLGSKDLTGADDAPTASADWPRIEIFHSTQSLVGMEDVRGVGDVNGDGISDIAIIVTQITPNNENSRDVYVVYGKAGFSSGRLDLAGLTQSSGFLISGFEDGIDHVNVDSGDLNGDGINDVVIRAYSFSYPNSSIPTKNGLFVFYGSLSNQSIKASDLNGTNGFRFVAGPDASIGYDFAVGDFNGDMIDDLAIYGIVASLEPLKARGVDYQKIVQVIYGSRATVPELRTFPLTSTNDNALIDFYTTGGPHPTWIGPAGDFDGDGKDDLAILGLIAHTDGPAMTSPPTLMVVYGAALDPTESITLNDLESPKGIALNTFADDDQYINTNNWVRLREPADFNGDGLDDTVVWGAGTHPQGPNGDQGISMTQIIFGGLETTAIYQTLAELDDSQVLRIANPTAAGESWRAPGFVRPNPLPIGDINGDGYADLMFGDGVKPWEELVIKSPNDDIHDTIPTLDTHARYGQGTVLFGNTNWSNPPRVGGEPVAPDMQVYVDVNNNNAYDDGEPTAISNSLGEYHITNVPAGTYSVHVVDQPAWRTVSGNSAAILSDVEVHDDQATAHVNLPLEPTRTGVIHGRVHVDADGNLPYNAITAAPLSGVTVFVDANRNKVLDADEQSATSDADGYFTIDKLSTGEHPIRMVPPTGWTSTHGDWLDAQVTNGLSTLVGVGAYPTYGFGIRGKLFNDLNSNGIYDPFEPNVEGTSIILDRDQDGAYSSGDSRVYPDSDGSFLIAQDIGEYHIFAELGNTGFRLTSGSLSHTATADMNSPSSYVEIPIARSKQVSGRLFQDINLDQDFAGEESFAGVNLKLTITDPANGRRTEYTTSSKAHGTFVFSGIQEFTDDMVIKVSDGGSAIDLSTPNRTYQLTNPINGGDIFDLELGAFRYSRIPVVSFWDKNGDGLLQSGTEPKLTSTMPYVDTNLSGSYDTNDLLGEINNGYQVLHGILEGRHTVRVDNPPNFAPLSGTVPSYTLDVSYGTYTPIAYFPFQPTGSSSLVAKVVSTPVMRPPSLASQAKDYEPIAGATVFVDLNRDGVKNAGEPETTSNHDGLAVFPGLADGDYLLQIDVPDGWIHADAAKVNGTEVQFDSSDITAIHPITLEPTVTMSGYVWFDENFNRKWDSQAPTESFVRVDNLGENDRVTTIEGEPNAWVGFNAVSAGDLNGDGRPDIVISFNEAKGDQNKSANQAYRVIFGNDQLDTDNLTWNEAWSLPGFTITAGVYADVQWYCEATDVQAVGDVNGDGLDDLAVRVVQGNAHIGPPNVIYFIWGQTDWSSIQEVDLSGINANLGASVIVPTSYSHLEFDARGDFNGDGHSDILIKDAFDDAFMVSGSLLASKFSIKPTDLTDANAMTLSNTVLPNGLMGVAFAGDLNADGFDDIVINRTSHTLTSSEQNYVSIVFGRPGPITGVFDLDSIDGSNGFNFHSIGVARVWGESAGDINHDGINDLIIGQTLTDRIGFDIEPAVIYGKKTGWESDLHHSDLDGTNGFRIKARDDQPELGIAASAVGDVNGDGIDDFMIVGRDRWYTSDWKHDSTWLIEDNTADAYIVFGRAQGFGSDYEISKLLTDASMSEGVVFGPLDIA